MEPGRRRAKQCCVPWEGTLGPCSLAVSVCYLATETQHCLLQASCVVTAWWVFTRFILWLPKISGELCCWSLLYRRDPGNEKKYRKLALVQNLASIFKYKTFQSRHPLDYGCQVFHTDANGEMSMWESGTSRKQAFTVGWAARGTCLLLPPSFPHQHDLVCTPRGFAESFLANTCFTAVLCALAKHLSHGLPCGSMQTFPWLTD